VPRNRLVNDLDDIVSKLALFNTVNKDNAPTSSRELKICLNVSEAPNRIVSPRHILRNPVRTIVSSDYGLSEALRKRTEVILGIANATELSTHIVRVGRRTCGDDRVVQCYQESRATET
jgi:hypothetical protein